MKVLHRRDASFKVLHWPKLFEGRISLADNYDNNYAGGEGAGRGYGYHNGNGNGWGYAHGHHNGNGGSE